jgi:hypothetical protein
MHGNCIKKGTYDGRRLENVLAMGWITSGVILTYKCKRNSVIDEDLAISRRQQSREE